MNNRAIKIQAARAVVAVGLLGLTGCGGGGGSGVGVGGPGNVDGFGFASNMVNVGPLDSSEPVVIDNIVLSTTETGEPDPRV